MIFRRKPQSLLPCSFCGKTEGSDGIRLVAGPAVFICSECVEVCVHALAEMKFDSRWSLAARAFEEVDTAPVESASVEVEAVPQLGESVGDCLRELEAAVAVVEAYRALSKLTCRLHTCGTP